MKKKGVSEGLAGDIFNLIKYTGHRFNGSLFLLPIGQQELIPLTSTHPEKLNCLASHFIESGPA